MGPNPPPPLPEACILKSPQPTICALQRLLQRFLWNQLHTKAQSHCRWCREDGDAPIWTLVTWVIGPESGRIAPLPNDWLPNHGQGEFSYRRGASGGHLPLAAHF